MLKIHSKLLFVFSQGGDGGESDDDGMDDDDSLSDWNLSMFCYMKKNMSTCNTCPYTSFSAGYLVSFLHVC